MNKTVIIIIVILAVLGVAVGAYALSKRGEVRTQGNDTSANSQDNQRTASQSDTNVNPNCQSNTEPTFTANPTDATKVELVQNPLMEVNSDIKTHSYLVVKERVPVYAPADASLTQGAKYMESPIQSPQYLLSFEVSCEVSYYFDHIVDTPDKIKNALPATPQNDTRTNKIDPIVIKAGELIGYSNQPERGVFDFGVINIKGPETSLTTNPKYKDNEMVKMSDKLRHAVCPYQYFEVGMRKTFLGLATGEKYGNAIVIDDLCKNIPR